MVKTLEYNKFKNSLRCFGSLECIMRKSLLLHLFGEWKLFGIWQNKTLVMNNFPLLIIRIHHQNRCRILHIVVQMLIKMWTSKTEWKQFYKKERLRMTWKVNAYHKRDTTSLNSMRIVQVHVCQMFSFSWSFIFPFIRLFLGASAEKVH